MAQDSPMIYPRLGEPLNSIAWFNFLGMWTTENALAARLFAPLHFRGMWEVRRLTEVPE